MKYTLNKSTQEDVLQHLQAAADTFIPPLSNRVELAAFAKKIVDKTMRFEAWDGEDLVGLVSCYCNQADAFINNVSVLTKYTRKGIAGNLMSYCLDFVKKAEFKKVKLEVDIENFAAMSLYEKFGFKEVKTEQHTMEMTHSLVRNYNEELKDTADHKYAYGFDFDVMHPFMIKSFEPFFTYDEDEPDNVLELGSFQGAFTERLRKRFNKIVCVEASDGAITIAKQKQSLRDVKFIHSTFETVNLDTTYHNIIMTHVLEHLDDPVAVLKRVNNEWLTKHGRFFVACPNANAPSRQIAVNMGLISHNTAITSAEAEHGHKITYTLDTLERDAKDAGLKVIHRGGIFFKALANFQWDRLLQTDIISKEYLDGCYQLGQKYPDLCSSIFLVCEKGSNE